MQPEDPKSESLKKIPTLKSIGDLDPDPNKHEVDGGIEEAKQLTRGMSADDLKREAEQNEHNRDQVFRHHFERIALFTLWAIFFTMLLLAGSWICHILLPKEFHWLPTDQLAKVQNLITGGMIASLAAGHFKKRMGQS